METDSARINREETIALRRLAFHPGNCHTISVDAIISYRGRVVSEEDISFINELIAAHPDASRRNLSKKLCEAWNWVQPNGQLRDMVCRSLMLELHRGGHIRLPAKRCTPNNPLATRSSRPAWIEVDRSPIEGLVNTLGSVEIRQVRATDAEQLYNSLIEHHHYFGYCHPVGEHLKYVVYAHRRPVACFAFCSAPRHIGCRDRFIGWNQEQRLRNLHLLAYNTRFLILPWVGVRNLASYLLSRMAKRIAEDWQQLYGHPVYLLTTFVDTERFTGGCYRAANWQYLGETTGRGKNDQTKRVNRSIKAVWGYPLRKDFRRWLCAEEAM